MKTKRIKKGILKGILKRHSNRRLSK